MSRLRPQGAKTIKVCTSQSKKTWLSMSKEEPEPGGTDALGGTDSTTLTGKSEEVFGVKDNVFKLV